MRKYIGVIKQQIDEIKDWKFIVFIFFFIMIMIYCSHKADEKVYTISKLKMEFQKLQSESLEISSKLMRVRLGTEVEKAIKKSGLKPMEGAKEIIVKPRDE
ncbi:FtsL-like putative cell division protein [Ichthyobacterium seriolicida]|uniref:S-adenosyl-methyltransferase n=1 Tax=Ichthyobacterium seriolicida TaxID=242600 RepID=A0A1J1EBE8_9FLAO|nr:FtsL-like putative cell division protein [Ichthyobacterium seriolicida]BAV95259.1 hypothetical protein JBKA6_1246 [Ichthyobacterium seriolicida]